MREFRKTEKAKPWWKVLLQVLLLPFGFRHGSKGHDDRMRKRRRKTKFDR